MNGAKSVDSFYAELSADNVGNSDSGLYMTDFQEVYPSAPTVIVERPIDDVFKSLAEFLPRMGFVNPPIKVLEVMAEGVSKLKGLRVDFDDINNRLEEIMLYLNIPYDENLAGSSVAENKQLKELSIDIDSYLIWSAI